MTPGWRLSAQYCRVFLRATHTRAWLLIHLALSASYSREALQRVLLNPSRRPWHRADMWAKERGEGEGNRGKTAVFSLHPGENRFSWASS